MKRASTGTCLRKQTPRRPRRSAIQIRCSDAVIADRICLARSSSRGCRELVR
jgi:hypothetical protein